MMPCPTAPWGNAFHQNKYNTAEDDKGGTTPVGSYSPQGDSPYGCTDMSGNVWEWTRSFLKPYPYNPNDGREAEKATGRRVLRGGSYITFARYARCAFRFDNDYLPDYTGFRLAVSLVLT